MQNTETVKVSQEHLANLERKRVLVVEDDPAQHLIWEKALKTRIPNVKIDWATSQEEAEHFIRMRFKDGKPYHLVVADVFLEGNGTGIGLWNKYGEEAMNFVFVSAMPISNYQLMMSLNYGSPPFLRKPIDAKKCGEVADLVFNSEAIF